MNKPRIRWSAEHTMWVVTNVNERRMYGFPKWTDAVGFALQHVDTISVFYRKPRIIGWPTE